MIDIGKELIDKSLAIAIGIGVIYLYEMRLRRKDNDDAQRWNAVSTLTASVAEVAKGLDKLADKTDVHG